VKTTPLVLATVAVGVLALLPNVAADYGYMPNTAGGGGWFYADMYKDSFGFYLNGEDWSESWLVFHGRDKMVKIQAYEFTEVSIEEAMGYGTAHAWGWTYNNGMDGYWFHLLVTDKGKGTMDVFHLWVYQDDGNGMMDEQTPILEWEADGLGGGNIWVVPPEM